MGKAIKTTVYGLRHKETKAPLVVNASANPEDAESISISYEFDTYFGYGDIIWLVSSKETAEKALHESPPWFNADYESPMWRDSMEPNDYEVYEVTIG